MSLTTITSCPRSSSSPIIRVFSKHRVHGTDPSNFDSRTSFFKPNCGGSESDGEYETSSEGHLHPGPETRPSLCRTRESGATIGGDDTSSKAEVSTELRLEVIESTKDNENSAKAEEFVSTLKDLTSPQPQLAKVSVYSIEKSDKLVPSFLESRLCSEANRSILCFLSDSRQTLQSMDIKSTLALSTAKTSTTDLQSVYKEKKFQSDTYSVETDSVYKVERNRFEFFEKHERFTVGGNMGLLKNTGASIDIGTNPEQSPCLFHPNSEKTNASYELKKNLIKRSHIMSQIDKELAPLRDKINQIFNQVRIDLRGLPHDICTNYDNLLGISKSGYFLKKENSILEKSPVSCHTSFLPSTEYTPDPSNSYRINKNYAPNILSPSEEKLRFSENLSYHPLGNINHQVPYSYFHKRTSPRHFENCRHAYLNNEIITLKNTHLQESFASNSLCSMHGHRVPHLAGNSRHISLNNFPVVREHLHSLNATVLPVNSENLHRYCRSKVPPTLETLDSKVHTESKIASNGNDVEQVGKHTVICRSRHRHSISKKESRENDSSLKSPLDQVKRYKKYESNESSSANRPRHFSGRRRCKCKRHHRDLRHRMDQDLSPADNSQSKSRYPEIKETAMSLENRPSSKNDFNSSKTLPCAEEPSHLITEDSRSTKEIVLAEKSVNQQKQDPENIQAPNSSSRNSIKSETKCSPRNSVLLKYSLTDGKVKLEDFSNSSAENLLGTEESSFPQETSSLAQNLIGAEESSFPQETSSLAQKKSSSILSYYSRISKPYTEHKEPIQVTEYNANNDKACNTENIDEPAHHKRNLLNLEKPALNTSTEIMKTSQSEIFEMSNFNQPLRVDVPKERITMTSIESQVSENGSRKSISSQHSKMSLPKTHERITIVPIIFSSGIPEPLSGNFNFKNSEKSGNTNQKSIPLNIESQVDVTRSSSESNFSLSTRAESFTTEITHLAKKCAFISDSKRRMNSRMTLNTASSSYSFIKPLESLITVKQKAKTSNESRTGKASSKSLTSYETFENPARNSVAVRRIRGIRTSPEDFMYE